MLISANDKCYKCGNKGHFVNECKIIKNVGSNKYIIKGGQKFCNLVDSEFDKLKLSIFLE